MTKRDYEGKQYKTDEVAKGRIPRRIILEKDKEILNPSLHVGIDITGMPNANSMVPVILLIQEKCNLGDWHIIDRIQLQPWGND